MPDDPVRSGELLAESVGFLLSKLGFETSAGFAAALEPLGIAPQHFGLLRYVEAAEGQSQQALAEALGMPASRVVAVVDELEAKGLVERRRNPSDRRAHALHLTTQGRELFDRAMTTATEYEAQVCAGLSDDERATLLDLLRRVAAGRTTRAGVHEGMVRPRANWPGARGRP